MLVGVPTIGLGLILCFMAFKEGNSTGVFGGILFFIGGCYLTHKIYTTKENRKLKGTWEVFIDKKADKNRLRNTLIVFGALGAILAFYIYLTYIRVFDTFQLDAWFSYLIFVVASVFYLVPLWSPKRKRIFNLTEAAILEKQRLGSIDAQKGIEDAKKWEEREKHWWFRYPLAALICVGAWWLSDIKPNMWWVGIIGVIYAMILAREISLLVLGIGAIYFLVQGIASLPVSVAIIIGALIIASVIKQ